MGVRFAGTYSVGCSDGAGESECLHEAQDGASSALAAPQYGHRMEEEAGSLIGEGGSERFNAEA
jgi:hypothetical protein